MKKSSIIQILAGLLCTFSLIITPQGCPFWIAREPKMPESMIEKD